MRQLHLSDVLKEVDEYQPAVVAQLLSGEFDRGSTLAQLLISQTASMGPSPCESDLFDQPAFFGIVLHSMKHQRRGSFHYVVKQTLIRTNGFPDLLDLNGNGSLIPPSSFAKIQDTFCKSLTGFCNQLNGVAFVKRLENELVLFYYSETHRQFASSLRWLPRMTNCL